MVKPKSNMSNGSFGNVFILSSVFLNNFMTLSKHMRQLYDMLSEQIFKCFPI